MLLTITTMQSPLTLTLMKPTPEISSGRSVVSYYAFEDTADPNVYYDMINFSSTVYDVEFLNYNAISAKRHIIGGDVQKIRVVTINTIVKSLEKCSKRKELLKILLPINTQMMTDIAKYHENIATHKTSGKIAVKYVGDIETNTGIYDTFVDSDGVFWHMTKDIFPLFKGVAGIKGTEGDVIINGTYMKESLISSATIKLVVDDLIDAIDTRRVKSQIKNISKQYDSLTESLMPVVPLTPIQDHIKHNDVNPGQQVVYNLKPKDALRTLVNDWIQLHPAENILNSGYITMFMIDCALTLKAYNISDKVIESGSAFSSAAIHGIVIDHKSERESPLDSL